MVAHFPVLPAILVEPADSIQEMRKQTCTEEQTDADCADNRIPQQHQDCPERVRVLWWRVELDEHLLGGNSISLIISTLLSIFINIGHYRLILYQKV